MSEVDVEGGESAIAEGVLIDTSDGGIGDLELRLFGADGFNGPLSFGTADTDIDFV